MKKFFTIAFVFMAFIGVLFAQGSNETTEEVVQYGDLDPVYVDKNGDMIADTPEDPSMWLDPDTLIFAYAPVEDPAVYEEVFVDFQKHLEEVTGKNVKWFAVTNYATQIEAMRAGRLHVSGFAAGTVQDAVNVGGFVPMVVMGTENGFVGYRMAIITYKGSGISTIDDIVGKNVDKTRADRCEHHGARNRFFRIFNRFRICARGLQPQKAPKRHGDRSRKAIKGCQTLRVPCFNITVNREPIPTDNSQNQNWKIKSHRS